MPLVQTRGAASAQGFGEFAVVTVPNYIEEVFSAYTYRGNSTARSIVNGIDLSTKGGLVWVKERTYAGYRNMLFDTIRLANNPIITSSTAAQITQALSLTAFNADGFSLGTDGVGGEVNDLGAGITDYVAWTFRKQPKFFDVVTWTGNATNRTIAHSLGAVPGSIIVKRTDTTADWIVYHRSLGATQYMYLNTLDNADTFINYWNSTAPTSAVFSLGTVAAVNASGGTYVAYIFAHDAGGFGLTGTDNVISCGTYAGTGAVGNTITLGYEPQWVMIKKTTGSANGNWFLFDNMRGMPVGSADAYLFANSSAAEASLEYISPTATGFSIQSTVTPINGIGETYIYIAIRRGPMKVPTVGTSVYNAIARTGTGATANVTGVGFPVDLNWSHIRDAAYPNVMDDRLRGSSNTLKPSTTDGEASSSTVTSFASMDGVQYGTSDRTNASGNTYINWYFKRAPSFFDEVCYTGTGVAMTVTHNLGVIPELMIVKSRSNGGTSQYFWAVYVAPLGNTANLILDSTDAIATGNLVWNNTSPTSSVFTVGQYNRSGASGVTYVAYLFATLASVSKVGSYTGTGALQTVNCGFTSGARFVLIKRSDSTGDWYMYDSVRGITSGNDPYLFANGPDAVEVTGTNYVDTDTTGFKVTAAAPAGLNANGGTYIFLAIA